ncbi:MAG: DegT/DnrJ/EryC1/StrS family aminotransferase [Anaerolineales bacterium]
MKIPLLDLQAQYATIRPEIDAAVQRVIAAQAFILGPEVAALESDIAAYCDAGYGIGVSSGTDALLLAMMVLELDPGDEVITTPYTFFATAGAITRLGLKPVFVDIDPQRFNIDPAKIEAAITPRTRAIIPVHLYGQMADMAPIMQLAAAHNLTVIEDAAQAIGAEADGARAGSVGHMATFSFFPSKNLGGFGDAGMVTTNDPALDEKLRLYRNHGFSPKYYNRVVGGNFRLDALQAAVLRVKLAYLDAWTDARAANAARYREMFAQAGLSIPLADVGCLGAGCTSDPAACALTNQPGVVLPLDAANGRHVYNQFVIRVGPRDALRAYLQDHDIGTEIYYPVPLHEQECFADLGHTHGDFPASECAARQTLALPIYPELTERMQARVVETIKAFFAEQRR